MFAESYDARTEYNTRLNVVNSADPNTAISESIGDIEYLLSEVPYVLCMLQSHTYVILRTNFRIILRKLYEDILRPVTIVLFASQVAECPNRSNPFHTCGAYCRERWGLRPFDPTSEMLAKVRYLHRRYPIPSGWLLVADPNTYVLFS